MVIYYAGVVAYGLLAANSLGNWLLMPRVGRLSNGQDSAALDPGLREQGAPSEEGRSRGNGASVGESVCILIPARNEAHNLPKLLTSLRAAYPQVRVYVFDDESTDETASIAQGFGAVVLKPSGPLPAGWTGKNRACDQLAKAAIEDSDAPYILFLDADTVIHAGLLEGLLLDLKKSAGVGVVSGMPRLIHGAFPEPLFLAWVPWILLSTNPFWLVARTGKGNNQFTNGQIVMWRKSVYAQIWPHERLKGAVLEDARIGRLLAKEKVGVRVLNLSAVLETHMYDTWKECLDGLSKNSFEIFGSHWGTYFLALLLLVIGWGWIGLGSLRWIGLGLLVLSGIFSSLGTRSPFYLGFLSPVNVSIGSLTLFRSSVWKKRGSVMWKGRRYG